MAAGGVGGRREVSKDGGGTTEGEVVLDGAPTAIPAAVAASALFVCPSFSYSSIPIHIPMPTPVSSQVCTPGLGPGTNITYHTPGQAGSFGATRSGTASAEDTVSYKTPAHDDTSASTKFENCCYTCMPSR